MRSCLKQQSSLFGIFRGQTLSPLSVCCPQAEKEKAGIVDEVEGDNRGSALAMSRSSAFGSLTRPSMAAK